MSEKPTFIEDYGGSFYDLLPNHGLVEYGYSDEDGSYDITLDIDRTRKVLHHQLADLYSSPTVWEKGKIEYFVNSTKFHIGDVKDLDTGAKQSAFGQFDRKKGKNTMFNLIQISPESIFSSIEGNKIKGIDKGIPIFTNELP